MHQNTTLKVAEDLLVILGGIQIPNLIGIQIFGMVFDTARPSYWSRDRQKSKAMKTIYTALYNQETCL